MTTKCKLCGCMQAVQQSFFGTAQNAELAILLDGSSDSKIPSPNNDDVIHSNDVNAQNIHVFGDSDTVAGKVSIKLRKLGSKLEHQGIKIEFVGKIGGRRRKEALKQHQQHHGTVGDGVSVHKTVIDNRLKYDTCHKKGAHHQFFHDERELAPPGELHRNTSFDFAFERCPRPYESYDGVNVQLKYFLRVTIIRRLSNIATEQEVLIHVTSARPEVTRGVKTEIGIGDQLRVELECNKWKYHLRDVICGSINFVSNEMDIVQVELQIIRREMTASSEHSSALSENEIVALFEILDGNPQSGDRIPIRLYLASYRLTPTMRNVADRFTVKYYLNLVLVDVDENRYFKQQEVTLYRKDAKSTPSKHSSSLPLSYTRDTRNHRMTSGPKITFRRTTDNQTFEKT